MTTYYEILGVGESASAKDIKDAYRRQAMKWHPDRYTSSADKAFATDRFKHLAEAYRVLGAQEKRRAYDDELRTQRNKAPGQTYSTTDRAARDNNSNHGDASSSRASKKRPAEEDEQPEIIFFEMMLDLAFEMADRGIASEQIRESLEQQGCPARLARHVASLVTRRSQATELPAQEQFSQPREQPPQAKSVSIKAETLTPDARPVIRLSILILLWVLGALLMTGITAPLDNIQAPSSSSRLLTYRFYGVAVVPALLLLLAMVLGWVGAAVIGIPWRYRSLFAFLGFLVFFWQVKEELTRNSHTVPARGAAPNSSYKEGTYPTGTSGVITSTSSPESQSRAPSASINGSRYDAAVRQIELRYPFLDPDSPTYDEQTVRWVIERTRFYAAGGVSAADALKLAVADMTTLPRTRKQSSATPDVWSASPRGNTDGAPTAQTICNTWPEACR